MVIMFTVNTAYIARVHDSAWQCTLYNDMFTVFTVDTAQVVRVYDSSSLQMKPVCLDDIGRDEADLLCQLSGKGLVKHSSNTTIACDFEFLGSVLPFFL